MSAVSTRNAPVHSKIIINASDDDDGKYQRLELPIPAKNYCEDAKNDC